MTDAAEKIPDELTGIAVDVLEEMAHEHCGEDGCPGNTQPYHQAAAKEILAAVIPEVRAAERAKVAEEFAAYRCDYELCGMCTCRADLVKLLRGES